MSTLIATTRSGVRPLGVRGEPLHNSAAQISRVVRRRLGDDAADLLAEPQLHEDGGAIIPVFRDWIDAHSDSVGGHTPHGGLDMDNGYILEKAFFRA